MSGVGSVNFSIHLVMVIFHNEVCGTDYFKNLTSDNKLSDETTVSTADVQSLPSTSSSCAVTVGVQMDNVQVSQ